MYGPILLRERAASTLCRFWRCARAKQVAQLKRWSNALAARVNPLVRGFLARRVTKKMFEEHYRKNRAVLLVRAKEGKEGWLAVTSCEHTATAGCIPLLHAGLSVSTGKLEVRKEG